MAKRPPPLTPLGLRSTAPPTPPVPPVPLTPSSTAPAEAKAAQSPPDEEAANRERVRCFLSLARNRFKLAEEAEAVNRRDALDDLKFSIGDQWPADIRTSRSTDGRPCLTMNRLPQFIRQVTNEQRQQRPAVQVNPIGDGADVETAEVLQGVIRHIEVNSNAEVAYDTAFDSMVRHGFGYLRLVTDYLDQSGFNQEIKIQRVANPFSVYFDPTAIEPDYSDAHWAFVVEDMSLEEFKLQFPLSTIAPLTDFSSIGDQAPGWATKDTIRIAEYWRVEETPRTLVRLANGSILDKAEAPEGAPIVASRRVLDRRVLCAKINAVEILEEGEWPGLWIPLIPVLGDDQTVDGKRHLSGLVRHAKDPQRMYNYWISAATETIALAPKAPFIGAEGQFENHESQWQQSNVRNFAFLEYKPTSVSGQLVPPPQRQVYEPPIQAMSLMVRQADNDLKATTGLYDASLGQRGPEQSGRAILARQRQGDMATLNYVDNLARAIRAVGRCLIDLIPHIYDVPRVVRIIKPDMQVEQAGLFNSRSSGLALEQALAALASSPAVRKVYDVGVGRYDVAVSVGPSYQSKRAEAAESMMTLVNAYPNLIPMVGDLLVRQFDWPYAQEISSRLKKLLPPQLQDQDDPNPAAAVQRLQAQLQALAAQHEALVKELNQASETIRTRKLELESRERIAALQAQIRLVETQAKIQGEAALTTLRAQIEDVQQRLTLLHEALPILPEEPEGAGGAGGAGAAGGGPGESGGGPGLPLAPPGTGGVQ